MVYNFLGIDEKIEKSTYIRSECPYSVFEHPYSVSKQKPRDYPPWHWDVHTMASQKVMFVKRRLAI